MPIYAFKCDTCGRVFDRSFRINDELVEITCPEGHVHTHRIFTAPTVIFKGPGFYINDSRSKHAKAGSGGNRG